MTARVHGPSVGSGVELAAFAGRVVAAPDATFALPEVAMGLVPGAGGTVSIPARIGRHRTAWLALTGERIDGGARSPGGSSTRSRHEAGVAAPGVRARATVSHPTSE